MAGDYTTTMPEQITVQLSQHSPFVHAVRREFLSDSNGFLTRLDGPMGEGWLQCIWTDIGKQMAEEDCPGVEHVDLPAADIAVSTHDLRHGITATVITLPGRLRTPQPYFIALIIPPPGVMMQCMGGRTTDEPRCFQLESCNGVRPAICL